MPGQFLPTLFLLAGLVLLGTRTVWFAAVHVPDQTTPQPIVVLSEGWVANYWYTFHNYNFDPKHPTSIIKTNLAGLFGLTILLELGLNEHTWQAEASTYFAGTMLHTPGVLCMKLLVLVLMWLAILYVNARENALSAGALMLAGTLAFFMMVLVSANNFIVFYIALEGVSLLSFVLAAQPKTNTSVESGLKYFFQSSLASILLLAGIAGLFAGAQDFDFFTINLYLVDEPLTELSAAAIFLITVALLFKVSAFPGHFGAPDVYRGPLTSILTIFAVVVKATAMLALFNVFSNFVIMTHAQFSGLIYLSSAASMLIGALGAIRVINERGEVRSFVAGTSVNQVGFVLLGLTCLNADGFISSVVYLVIYLLSSLLFLGVLSRLRFGEHAERSVTRLMDLRTLFAGQPRFSRRADAFIITYSIWSMAGLPPLAGFFGKVALRSSLIRKMQDLASFDSGIEVQNAFPFIDITTEFDPYGALVAILLFSVVVSIVSAVYYFELYELIAPPASAAEAAAQPERPKVGMLHDFGSIAVTGLLLTALTFGVYCISFGFSGGLLSYPAGLDEIILGPWTVEFNEYYL